MYLSSLKGGIFFQPLSFQFSNVEEFAQNDKILNEQIMLGPALLLNPLLTENENNVRFAIPNDNWNIFPSGDSLVRKNENENLRNNNFQYMEFTGKFSDLHLFMRGGHIIPYYDTVQNENILRSKDLEDSYLTIMINPDSSQKASGEVIFDDTEGNPYETIEEQRFIHVNITFNKANKEINFEVLKNNVENYAKKDIQVTEIIIFSYGDTKDNFANQLRFMSEEKNNSNSENLRNASFKIINGNFHISFKQAIDLRNIGKITF